MYKYAVAAAMMVAFAAPAPVFLSLLAAFASVMLPQEIALYMQRRGKNRNPFSFWAVKFSLTFLLLLVSIRALQESEMLAALYFIVGTAAGVLANVAWLAQMARRQNIKRM